MLIAEELLLQVTKPDGTLLAPVVAKIHNGLAGALLSDLALLEKITIDERGRLQVLDLAPTGPEILDTALEIFAKQEGQEPKNVIMRVAVKDPAKHLYQGLAAAGYVREERSKVLRVFTRTTWPVTNLDHQDATRQELTDVLLGATPPDARTASLISLLRAVDGIAAIFEERTGLDKKGLQERAKAISEGNWAGAAANKAIAQAQAAINAATAAAAAATATSVAISATN